MRRKIANYGALVIVLSLSALTGRVVIEAHNAWLTSLEDDAQRQSRVLEANALNGLYKEGIITSEGWRVVVTTADNPICLREAVGSETVVTEQSGEHIRDTAGDIVGAKVDPYITSEGMVSAEVQPSPSYSREKGMLLAKPNETLVGRTTLLRLTKENARPFCVEVKMAVGGSYNSPEIRMRMR